MKANPGRAWRDIRDGMRSRPGRTALTWTAVAISLFGLYGLLAVLGGLRIQARAVTRELGADGFLVAAGGPDGLPAGYAERLAANLPECRVAAGRRYRLRNVSGAADGTVAALAVTRRFPDVRPIRRTGGRLPDPLDHDARARRIVVGDARAERDGWRPGTTVELDGIVFEVIGTTTHEGLDGADLWLPLETAAALFDSPAGGPDRVDVVWVRAPEEGWERALAAARRILSAPEAEPVHAVWVTPDMLLDGVRRLRRSILLAAGGALGFCLALAGVTLTALLAASVRERVPEIGLRRALGAMPADIGAIFMLESVLLCSSAATVACGIGSILARVTASRLDWPIAAGPAAAGPTLAAAIVFGALCAWIPARMAARLSPAEALRIE